MSSLKAFAEALPGYAKDLKLNLSSLLGDQLLDDATKFGLILSCAHGSGYRPLVEAAERDCADKLSGDQAEAARGAAAVMAMNNVYYRFTHLVGNEAYATMPARLRMNIIVQHGISKADFELYCLAVSAMNGCGACMESHEKQLVEHGVKPQTIQAAARVAAILKGVATVHATL